MNNFEPSRGLEPRTSSLRRNCSAIELGRHNYIINLKSQKTKVKMMIKNAEWKNIKSFLKFFIPRKIPF